MPSSSVSGSSAQVSNGSHIPFPFKSSKPFEIPSLSQSFVAIAYTSGSQGSSGSDVPVGTPGVDGSSVPFTSSPSVNPSSSESESVGSVPAASSSAFVKPSPSQSFVGIAVGFGSQGSSGSEPQAISFSSACPSLSSSGSMSSQIPSPSVSPVRSSPSHRSQSSKIPSASASGTFDGAGSSQEQGPTLSPS